MARSSMAISLSVATETMTNEILMDHLVLEVCQIKNQLQNIANQRETTNILPYKTIKEISALMSFVVTNLALRWINIQSWGMVRVDLIVSGGVLRMQCMKQL